MKMVCSSAVIGLLLLFTACGGGDSSGGTNPNNTQLTSGNWGIEATSQVLPSNGTAYIGGNINHSGTSITGVMHIFNSSCFDFGTNIYFSGTSNGNSINFTSAPMDGQVVSVTATASGSKSLSGTYSIAGGCSAGDHGTISGTFVPSISGTWKATETVGSQTLTTTATVTQQATADQWGTFPLSGSITFAGPTTCFTGGTINVVNSFIAGDLVAVLGDMTVPGGGSGQLYYVGFLNNPAAPTQIVGMYDTESTACSLSGVDLTFMKQ